MTADEYYRLDDDGFRYELIDGVICMSPSPTPNHQNIALRISSWILAHLERHPVGTVLADVDVHLGIGPNGGDLVYRPDIVFLRGDPSARLPARIVGAPALVVEIVSSSSRRLDSETKKNDYERCGVSEYWLVDPEVRAFTFYRLQDGRYVEVPPQDDKFASQALPGFVLDLSRVRRLFA